MFGDVGRSRTLSASGEVGGQRTEHRRAALRSLLLTLVAVTVTPAMATAATDEVVVVLEFDPAQLGFDRYEGYDVVTLDGAEFMVEPAEPMLPALNVQLLLPPDATCTGVAATCRRVEAVPGTYEILPAPRPARYSSRAAAKVPQPNAQIYDSVLPYPREVARLAGVGNLAGNRIASVQVAPLSYVPATGEIYIHREIEVVLETETLTDGNAHPAAGQSGVAHTVVERSVMNPRKSGECVVPDIERSGGDEPFDYLVVCPESYAGEFERLAEWKTRKGVRANIVTLESIAADPLLQGVDLAESVRNCIKHHYEESGISWVLLGGDTEIVPAREAHDFFYDQGLPCDLYYADLDGSWDADGDGRWGENGEDGIDMYADVFVGRAPVASLAEAASFVDRVLAYEGAAFAVADDYQLSMLYLGEILWDSPDPYTDGAVACDMVDDYVPERFDPARKLYESNGNLSLSLTLPELESGCGLVLHQGHSNVSEASIGPDELTIETLAGLTNGERGGVWYSVGCWSAAIDHDAFGEHWVIGEEGGGVAYVGNSRYGWGCPGFPGQCVSDLYSQQFFNSLFEKDLVHAGVVHADAKHHYVGLAKADDYMRYAMYELNLLGDPEMPIWTDSPRPLDVTYEISGGSAAELDVWVESGGVPVEGARVCVFSSDAGVFEVAETDAAGRSTIAVAVDQPFESYLTVTARNAVPNGASIVFDGETGVTEGEDEIGAVTALAGSFPNPFSDSATVAFSLGERARVGISVYDVSGRLVAVLIDEEMPPGSQAVRWDGRDARGNDVSSGTYFARMTAGGSHFETKMILTR